MATYEQVRPAERLAQLAREYRHVQQEHAREAPGGSPRRRLQGELERIAEQFERVLTHWVADDEMRAAWRAHLYDGAEAPDGPVIEPPRLFKGQTEAGSRLEIRLASDGGYDVVVDGSRLEHHAVPWHLDPESREPFRVGQFLCREVFDAPDEAIRALARFVAEPETPPPMRWARELFEDGLIDVQFALTPRGRRALTPAPLPAVGTGRSSFCVVSADSARARILALAATTGEARPLMLVEVADLANPAARARDSDLFSDTRPGLRREGGHGPRHGVADRRDRQRQESERKFAEQVAAEAEGVWRNYQACRVVVVAAPKMLGYLRPAIARRRRATSPLDVQELDKDLSHLAPPALHDALADAALLPPRRPRSGPSRVVPGT